MQWSNLRSVGIVSGILLGATIGSLLMLIGWLVHERYPDPPRCRDGLRFLTTDDVYVPCLSVGANLQLVEIGNRAAALCTCGEQRPALRGPLL